MYQTRTSNARFQVSDNRRLSMYASVFDTPTTIRENNTVYREVIRPGAFSRSLNTNADVLATVNHDPAQTFARTTDGTLLVQEDPKGLFASCWLPETPLGDRVLQGVQDGTITGCSFRFAPIEDRVNQDGTVERVAVQLYDVCVALGVPPAYPGTEVHVRTADPTQTLLLRLRLQKLKLKA